MSSLVLCRAASIILAAVSFCGSAGCGKKNALHGTVTYDGQLVDRGIIVFIPADQPNADAAQQAKVADQIVDGKYSLSAERPLPPGKYRVEITWDKIIGKTVKSKNNVKYETEQLLPDKYNKESTLIREIKSSDSKLDFELEK
jgi:hypothetical protein